MDTKKYLISSQMAALYFRKMRQVRHGDIGLYVGQQHMFMGNISPEKPGKPAGPERLDLGPSRRIVAHRDHDEQLRHLVAQDQAVIGLPDPIEGGLVKVEGRARWEKFIGRLRL